MRHTNLFFVITMLCMATIQIHAQDITVKSVSLRPTDLTARTSARTDSQGNNCALIKVAVVGVDDLSFPDAVGSTEYSNGEYLVYMPKDTKFLQYERKSEGVNSKINFEEYGIEIEESRVYSIVLTTGEQQRTATFFIEPLNAVLKIDGKVVKFDENGKVTIPITEGVHPYEVTAEGFVRQTGNIPQGGDDWSNAINLDPILHEVSFLIIPAQHTLFIDNKHCDGDKMELSEGNHEVRITADGYDEYTQTLSVTSNMASISISLEKAKEKVIKDKKGQSERSASFMPGFYLSGGFSTAANNVSSLFKDDAWSAFVEWSYIGHFAYIMSWRAGLGFGGWWAKPSSEAFRDVIAKIVLMDLKAKSNDDYKLDDVKKLLETEDEINKDNGYHNTYGSIFFDVPLQLGVSLHLGRYNQFVFSALGGGYGRLYWLKGDEYKEESIDTKQTSKNNYDSYYNYGKSYQTSTDDSENLVKKSDYDSYFDYGVRLSAKLEISRFLMGLDLSQSLNKLGFSLSFTIGYKFKTNK